MRLGKCVSKWRINATASEKDNSKKCLSFAYFKNENCFQKSIKYCTAGKHPHRYNIGNTYVMQYGTKAHVATPCFSLMIVRSQLAKFGLQPKRQGKSTRKMRNHFRAKFHGVMTLRIEDSRGAAKVNSSEDHPLCSLDTAST